ncbi:hypothetical protein AAF712_015764 [Marasmius tenuissimus]|uniref:Uncharacterized protein n=1 Tax=Marasmius tenuissimus TaxID=585030 RepID=A0ABR2Z8I2_9AGAR
MTCRWFDFETKHTRAANQQANAGLGGITKGQIRHANYSFWASRVGGNGQTHGGGGRGASEKFNSGVNRDTDRHGPYGDSVSCDDWHTLCPDSLVLTRSVHSGLNYGCPRGALSASAFAQQHVAFVVDSTAPSQKRKALKPKSTVQQARSNTLNSNVVTPTGFNGAASLGHEQVASVMAHRSAPASTTLTDFEAPSIPAEPRRNRAVASSWPKVQAEVEAQDTTSQAETSIIPETEAGPSTLNRSNPAGAEVPAGSKNVLALSADFPITKLPASEKPQATYSLSLNTKSTPPPEPFVTSFGFNERRYGYGRHWPQSYERRIKTSVDEPPSQSVPVAFSPSASSENSGTSALSQSSSSSSLGLNGSSSKNPLDARTGAGVSGSSIQDKGKGKETERATSTSTPLPASFFGTKSRKTPIDPISSSRNDAAGSSSTAENSFDFGRGVKKAQGDAQTPEDRDKGKQPECAASPSEGKQLSVQGCRSSSPAAAASSPQTTTGTDSSSRAEPNSTPFIPKLATTTNTPLGFSFTGTGIANVTPNPKTTTVASSSQTWRTITRPKFSFAPSPSVSNPNPFDFATPPPGNHTRATFHPFPQSGTSLTSSGTAGTTDSTPSTSTSAPATASGSQVPESRSKGGGVDSGSGSGEGSKAGPSASGSGTTNVVPPHATVTSSSSKKSGPETGRTITSSNGSLPGERPRGGGLASGTGAGVSVGTTTTPAPATTSTSTAETGHGGSSLRSSAPFSSPSVTRTGTGTLVSTVPQAGRTIVPASVPVNTQAQPPTRPADGASLGPASGGSATVLTRSTYLCNFASH